MATRKQIRKYKKEMSSKGINVVVDKNGKILDYTKAVGFDYSLGTVYIKSKPGVLDLYHEGYHAEQFIDIGQDAYIKLGQLSREEYAYSRIVENSHLFNDAELNASLNYINRLRNK